MNYRRLAPVSGHGLAGRARFRSVSSGAAPFEELAKQVGTRRRGHHAPQDASDGSDGQSGLP